MSFGSLMMRYIDYITLPDRVTSYGVRSLCQRTARKLTFAPANCDSDFVNRMSARRITEATERRWRRFFLAIAGLFGLGQGVEWGVSHYLLSEA